MYLTIKDIARIFKDTKPFFDIQMGDEFSKLRDDLVDGKFQEVFKGKKKVSEYLVEGIPELEVEFYPVGKDRLVFKFCCVFMARKSRTWAQMDREGYMESLDTDEMNLRIPVKKFMDSVNDLSYEYIEGAEVKLNRVDTSSRVGYYRSNEYEAPDGIRIDMEVTISYV